MPPSPSGPKDRSRLIAEREGRRAEVWAALFLRLKGYRIRAQRVKTPVGELDLVAERGGMTVFVEVKSRAFSAGEEAAFYAVNRHRIVRAAQYYLTRHPKLFNAPMRFDVIFLAPFAWPRHLKNAFDASGR